MTDKLAPILEQADALLELAPQLVRAYLPLHADKVRAIALRLREIYAELDAERRRLDADACCMEETWPK